MDFHFCRFRSFSGILSLQRSVLSFDPAMACIEIRAIHFTRPRKTYESACLSTERGGHRSLQSVDKTRIGNGVLEVAAGQLRLASDLGSACSLGINEFAWARAPIRRLGRDNL